MQNRPKGFCWLQPDMLGGMAKPDASALKALQALRVGFMVSLTAEWQPDVALCERFGLASLYVPITDFQPPSLEQAAHVCREASAYIARQTPVVFHCQAGKGRTGTLLAAMLIWAGQSADAAIAQTKARNAAWIETEGQLDFLAEFAAELGQ